MNLADMISQRDAQSLLSTEPPYLHLIVCSTLDFTDLGWAFERELLADGVVRRVRGSKMRSTEALFAEMAAVFQFPAYFGENWPALDECLSDLDWLPGSGYLVLVSDAVQTLSESPIEFSTMLKIMIKVAEEWRRPIEGTAWDRPGLPFHVIMQCESEDQRKLEKRIETSGFGFTRLQSAVVPRPR